MTGRVPDPAELAEDLTRIETAIGQVSSEMRTGFASLGQRMEDRYVTKEAHVGARRLVDQQFKTHGDKIEQIEGRFTWIARTSVTALVLPVLVLIIGALILTMGVGR